MMKFFLFIIALGIFLIVLKNNPSNSTNTSHHLFDKDIELNVYNVYDFERQRKLEQENSLNGGVQNQRLKKTLISKCIYLKKINKKEVSSLFLNYHINKEDNITNKMKIMDYKIIEINENMIQYQVNEITKKGGGLSNLESRKLLKNYLKVYIKIDKNVDDNVKKINFINMLNAYSKTINFCNQEILTFKNKEFKATTENLHYLSN